MFSSCFYFKNLFLIITNQVSKPKKIIRHLCSSAWPKILSIPSFFLFFSFPFFRIFLLFRSWAKFARALSCERCRRPTFSLHRIRNRWSSLSPSSFDDFGPFSNSQTNSETSVRPLTNFHRFRFVVIYQSRFSLIAIVWFDLIWFCFYLGLLTVVSVDWIL